MKMNEWLILAVLDAFFAALATIFAKIGLQNVDSMTATALRSIVMMFFAVGMMLAFRGTGFISSITSREAIYIILSGIAGGASWILYFLALQKGETTPVSLVDKSSLAFVVLLSVLVLHEELTLKKIVAVGLVLAAIYILAI
ncbi:EamA family transporter [Thermofilum sp.]|jgi:transporter family protein|uniref:EamA family transporter n=1 Tax=Thermofilum sp. TaxID=1961369 RepID=UPI002585079E|nr:EamA family transporter [Thermofilum sp.]